jgi:hypothetical protein
MTEFVSWLNKDGSSNIVLHLRVLGLMVSSSFLRLHLILIAVTTLEKCPCTWRVSYKAEFPTPAWSRRFPVRECRYLCKAMSAVDASFVTKGKAKHCCQCLPHLVHRAESTDSSAFPYTYTALILGLATQKYELQLIPAGFQTQCLKNIVFYFFCCLLH